MSDAQPSAFGRRRRFDSIPGLSDQPGLPRLGKFRLGIRETSGSGYPIEVKHFIFDPEDSIGDEARADLCERFVERYGDQPQAVDNVVFVAANRFDAFSSSLEWWGAGKLLCHGDGQEAERLVKETGEWRPMDFCAQTGRCPEWASGKQCKMTARLRFMLPDITLAGYFQLDTSSKYSAANIRDGLNLLESLWGHIHGIPVTLTRAPRTIEYAGRTATHYIVHLYAPNVTHAQAVATIGRPQLMLAPTAIAEAAPPPAPEPVTLPIAIPENDVPEELVTEDVVDELEAETEGEPLRVMKYKVAKSGENWTLFVFVTSDGKEHRTFSQSAYDAVKLAKSSGATVRLRTQTDDQGREEVVLVEVVA